MRQKNGLSKRFKKFSHGTSKLFSKENQKSKKSKTLHLSIIICYKYHKVVEIKMAKQSMIQREKKREYLIAKYETKRALLKQQLNDNDGYKVKLQIYKKFATSAFE